MFHLDVSGIAVDLNGRALSTMQMKAKQSREIEKTENFGFKKCMNAGMTTHIQK